MIVTSRLGCEKLAYNECLVFRNLENLAAAADMLCSLIRKLKNTTQAIYA
jgi:hypothetical protein